ncbi:Uma2 family endonuclease [Roseibacillus ishigakijimensis]|uniref:Uma2 family endonuclease n=1 Tax=Roseibacillus ishigakijimensis TaxID=454146 RepID=A0A934RJ46_9BACT|nr:Uma2 family endonuclease [Roseibacillus ishigakijimensis]MBK1832597.1 Uma2 family endonuclease [Roseibacillus ishigakijimensis]
MKSALEEIRQSPRLPEIVRTLTAELREEEERRRRFLQELTPEMKAEFINGEVIMHSPAREKHLRVTGNLFYELMTYCKQAGRGRVFVEKCLISLSRNDFEPDVVWFSEEKAREFTGEQMRFPAPDLVVEVLSPSTEERDRGVKFVDYAEHGVGEYWLIDAEAGVVEQYLLNPAQGEFTLHEKLTHGTVCSRMAAGLEVSLQELFAE